MKLTKILGASLLVGGILISTIGCPTTGPTNPGMPDWVWRQQEPYWKTPIMPHYNNSFYNLEK